MQKKVGNLINIANIRAFPKPQQFINLVKNLDNVKEVSKNWINTENFKS